MDFQDPKNHRYVPKPPICSKTFNKFTTHRFLKSIPEINIPKEYPKRILKKNT